MQTTDDKLCSHILATLLSSGVELDLIRAGCEAYARRVERTGEKVLPLPMWLIQRGWEQYRH